MWRREYGYSLDQFVDLWLLRGTSGANLLQAAEMLVASAKLDKRPKDARLSHPG